MFLTWPTGLQAVPPANRGLVLALAVSVFVHAVVLSIHFRLPERLLNKVRDSQLEVVLVNAKSASKPADPQARAQANLDGGGNTDENRRAKTPLPPLRTPESGTDLIQAQQKLREVEAQQRKLMTQLKSQKALPSDPKRNTEAEETPRPASGVDLAQNALAMARMEAQIERQVEEYNKRPRKKFIGARTSEAVEAQYVEDWRHKVERVGNFNYPAEARGKLYGNLVLSVAIRADGEVESVDISRSSGHKVLDSAARRIVELAAPFGAFPPKLRQNVDILVITRTWAFTKSDQLQAE
ncbi:MAG: TonB family protein [Rhodocyclaceae bacterium]